MSGQMLRVVPLFWAFPSRDAFNTTFGMSDPSEQMVLAVRSEEILVFSVHA